MGNLIVDTTSRESLLEGQLHPHDGMLPPADKVAS